MSYKKRSSQQYALNRKKSFSKTRKALLRYKKDSMREKRFLTKPEWMTQEEWDRATPCVVCGRRYWDEWYAPDKEWSKYVPLKYQDKEVCQVCYERFMEPSKRIQRKRSKGYRMPKDAVYVGRPTKWGNPYRIGVDGSREEIVKMYEIWLKNRLRDDPHFLDELKGKDLACWCPLTVPCHADIILKVLEGWRTGMVKPE